uniref:Uncharacterized protein n=1 Tax=Attheya septentrionalis TaxID=420275 RepID=A0A6T7IQP1_9STRA|mmetsp:Transcript_26848/g.48788  ORF Transcript_26848/g.48788 Transcript_26848/m.48788 type:complete len:275 (+) Transcript_26848:271-1095(+)
MVQNEVENEEAIMVQAIKPTPDVGSAIDSMGATLAKSGFGFQYPTLKNPDTKNKVAGKLLRLPMIIHTCITHAIDSTTATETSIGKVSTIEALVPGNVVALHSPDKNCFLRIFENEASFGSGVRCANELPLAWDSERFLVVDAGNGKISLFSPSHRRFLGCQNGVLTASGYPITSPDDRPRAHEIFDVENHSNNDSITLFCEIEGKFGKLEGQDYFQVVQIQDFFPESNNLSWNLLPIISLPAPIVSNLKDDLHVYVNFICVCGIVSIFFRINN